MHSALQSSQAIASAALVGVKVDGSGDPRFGQVRIKFGGGAFRSSDGVASSRSLGNFESDGKVASLEKCRPARGGGTDVIAFFRTGNLYNDTSTTVPLVHA